jgi:hypothetical protein
VTEDGKVGYDADFAGFLSGAGGSTLKLRGHSVGVDATPLSYEKLDLQVAGVERSFDSNAPQSLQLLPGPHRLEAPEKSFAVAFDVTVAGSVSYDSGLGGLLSGGDTSRLVVQGHEVGVDARPLSYEKLALRVAGVDGEFDSTTPQSFQMLPGAHRVLVPARSFDFGFVVTAGGKVDYDAGLNGLLSGGGTRTLKVRGYSITVDATQLSYLKFGITNPAGNGLVGPKDVASRQLLHLLPGDYRFAVSGADVWPPFQVTDAGTVEYDDQWASVFSGEGTSTLTVSNLGQNQVYVASHTTDGSHANPRLDHSAVDRVRFLAISILLLIVVGLHWRTQIARFTRRVW